MTRILIAIAALRLLMMAPEAGLDGFEAAVPAVAEIA
jgi:hypothetical protein